MKKITFCLCFLCISLGLLSCQQQSSDSSYFPLGKGRFWQYQISTQFSNQSRPSKTFFSVRATGEKKIIDKDNASIATQVRHTSEGTDYYFQENDKGVFRVAKRTVVESKPRLDNEPRMVLPSKQQLKQGAIWNNDSALYVIHSQPSYDIDLSSKRFNMTYEILETNDSVTVPAGYFENCIKVMATAKMRLYADARTGYNDVPITQYEWYAPNVGLVKLTRSEPINKMVYIGGEVSYELIDYND